MQRVGGRDVPADVVRADEAGDAALVHVAEVDRPAVSLRLELVLGDLAHRDRVERRVREGDDRKERSEGVAQNEGNRHEQRAHAGSDRLSGAAPVAGRPPHLSCVHVPSFSLGAGPGRATSIRSSRSLPSAVDGPRSGSGASGVVACVGGSVGLRSGRVPHRWEGSVAPRGFQLSACPRSRAFVPSSGAPWPSGDPGVRRRAVGWGLRARAVAGAPRSIASKANKARRSRFFSACSRRAQLPTEAAPRGRGYPTRVTANEGAPWAV